MANTRTSVASEHTRDFHAVRSSRRSRHGRTLFAVDPIRSRGRWIEATESGITSSWGQSFHTMGRAAQQAEMANKALPK